MTLKPPPSHHQPPKPRRLTTCHRHPNQPITSLCASCLRERLSLLNPPTSSNQITTTIPKDEAICSSSHSPELRRCKTFSGNKSIGPSFEPRRRSCEVRDRHNSLSNLFHLDDDGSGIKCQVESKNLGILKGKCTVPPVLNEEDDEIDSCVDEIRVSDSVRNVDLDNNELIVEEDVEDSKTIKEFIDLDFKASNRNNNKLVKKDLKEIAGSFWIAASVFSKKFHKWKRKQNNDNRSNNVAGNDEDDVCKGGGSACAGGIGGIDGTGLSLGEMRIENLRGRRLRDSQSEDVEDGFRSRHCDRDPSIEFGRASIDCGMISLDGFGRKSCDNDPRSSIDLGRASVDGCNRLSIIDQRRCSFDQPRASWDGYLIGRTMRTPPPRPMVSVIENAMATVYGFGEKVNIAGEDERKLVGSDCLNAAAMSSQRRKKESDHADTNRNTKGLHSSEDEAKSVPANPKVSPPCADRFHVTKLVITEKELMGSRFDSHRDDDSSESFESASKDAASSSSVSSSSFGGNGVKKRRQWSKILSVWGGLLSRRKHDKSGSEEDKYAAADSLTERESNGEVTSMHNMKLVRSSSVATSRSSNMMRATSEHGMKSKNEINKKHGDLVLKRNQSARHSPSSSLDNSMLRFYLTPLRSYRRSKLGKSRLKKSQSLARSVLGMY